MRWDNLPDGLEGRVTDSVGGGQKQPKNKRKNKYNNKKTEVDGIVFDSKKEADFYHKLKLLESNGIVEEFERQPRFLLQESFDDKEGNHHRPIHYRADYWVKYDNGKEEVIDVKGYKTNVYKLKKKLFLYKYPEVNFREVYSVKFSKSGGSHGTGTINDYTKNR